MNTEEVKALVENHAPRFIDAYGLHDWRIVFEYKRLEDGTKGEAHVNAAYLQAVIDIDPNQIEDPDDLVAVVRHELGHVMCWPIHAFGQHYQELTKGESMDATYEFYVERMVWAVERMLRRYEESDDEEHEIPGSRTLDP